MEEYKRAYEDSEATHALRQQAEAALRAEVASLKVVQQGVLRILSHVVLCGHCAACIGKFEASARSLQ
jgi:hypothetical protein